MWGEGGGGVFFSSDKIGDFIISQIRRATENIVVVHGFFDYKPIADALIERNQNNVDVVILTDISVRDSQMIDATSIYDTSLLKYLYINGMENIYIYNESSKKRMHNKYLLFDNNYFIYGSYNFHRDSAVFDEESVIAYENKEIYKKLFDEYLYLKSKAFKYYILDKNVEYNNFICTERGIIYFWKKIKNMILSHKRKIAIFSIVLNIIFFILLLIVC